MKILIINAGSSSLKFQIFELKQNLNLLYKGHIDELGKKNSKYHEDFQDQKTDSICSVKNFDEGIQFVLNKIHQKKIIKNPSEISAVGHRVVHGGEKYTQPVVINQRIEKAIQSLSRLAPLHNPPNLAAIRACRKILKKIPHVAIFDTAFHQTIPEKAFLYALPYSFYKKMGIRRYGFHGTSHAYVSHETDLLLNKPDQRVIICHLGNGSSITAIKNGKSIDTSMGFTPLEGIPMGTRSGDFDPAIIFYLIQKSGYRLNKIADILNKKSGLLGLSELSPDMRVLWQNHEKEKSKRAISVLAYRIAKYIGSYAASLNGLDALSFTGGIGENAWYLREEICQYLQYLGLKIDPPKNQKNQLEIQSPKSKVKVYVIPTNEEKQIALELISKLKLQNQ